MREVIGKGGASSDAWPAGVQRRQDLRAAAAIVRVAHDDGAAAVRRRWNVSAAPNEFKVQ